MMVELRKLLEALYLRSGGPSTSTIWENLTLTRVYLTILLLIELLKKQGKQLRKLNEKKEYKHEDDNSN